MKKYFAAVALLATGVLVGRWIWRDRAAVPTSVAQPAPVSVTAKKTDAVAPEVPAFATKPSAPTENPAHAATLAKARQLLDRLKTLQQVDSIENLHAAAEVELEFNELLDDGTAPLLVQEMPPDFVTTWFGDLALRRWAGADRQAAADWMAQHPSDSPIAATALAHDWALEEPTSLHTYVDRLPAGAWKHNLLKTAGEETLVADRISETFAFLNKIKGEDARRDELYEWTVTKWALKEPEAAAEWAVQAASPAQREKFLSAAVIGYANVEPAGAANLALRTIADQSALLPALNSVGRIWAARDAAAAAGWVRQLPAGPVRTSALDGLLAVWALADFEKASAWQSSLEEASLREQAAGMLTQLKRPFEEATGPEPVGRP